jgi:hypothetical protein
VFSQHPTPIVQSMIGFQHHLHPRYQPPNVSPMSHRHLCLTFLQRTGGREMVCQVHPKMHPGLEWIPCKCRLCVEISTG